MHTFVHRLGRLCSLTITVLAVVIIGVLISTLVQEYRETIEITVEKPIVQRVPFRAEDLKRNDLGNLTFNVDLNLNSLFNWNVKELFLYLIAEYVTPSNSLNQVVIWDKIILHNETKEIYLNNIPTTYEFWDDGEHLRSTNVTLSLGWNVIRNAGQLSFMGANRSVSFIFPDHYVTSHSAISEASV